MSEVNKNEMVSGILIIVSYFVTIYMAYRMAARDGKGNRLRIILNWFFILLSGELISLFIIVAILSLFSLDQFLPDIFVSHFLGFMWCYYIYSLFFIPFFIILWIYNIVVYIRNKEDAI